MDFHFVHVYKLKPKGRRSMILQLKNVRIAFCQNLFRPGTVTAADKPAYSATFIIPKDDPQIAKIKKTIISVAEEKWEKKAEEVLKSLKIKDMLCLHDGDGKAQYDGFEGCMYISARNAAPPLVIDRDRTKLTENDGRPYAGCYVNCSLDIWAQDNKYGKRINAKLRGVQFFADGDAFVGSAPASEDEFDDLSDTGENAGESDDSAMADLI